MAMINMVAKRDVVVFGYDLGEYRSDEKNRGFELIIYIAAVVNHYAILAWLGGAMLDTIQLPLLLKAIDFVFDEGRKILEERRERRKLNDHPSKNDESDKREIVAATSPAELQEKPDSKQDLITSRVDEVLWQNHEDEIKHLVKLLETYSKNYHLANEQYAKWGSALVPPIIVHNMEDAETSMIKTIKQLEIILSKVYNKDIHITK
jgi:hypothetical protein